MRRGCCISIIPCLIAGLTLFDRNPAAAEEPPPRPNVILIVAEDLGYADLGCQGARDFETPLLDRMAREGVRLTTFYSADSEGAAARRALLTGRYPDRTSADGVTIENVLRSAGYATLSLEAGTLLEPGADMRLRTRRLTERAIEFVREKRDVPFFLYLIHPTPGVPLAVSDAFSSSAKYGLYGDAMQELDWSVGAILSTVSDLEIDLRTLAIFTSGNGPWLQQGAHGGKADPLRDGKFSRHEGGHRVPCLMRWPGRIPAGVVREEMVASIDLAPTLSELAGAKWPADAILDGLDVWTYLAGKAEKSPRDTFFFSPDVVRRGDWKLMLPGTYREAIPQPGAKVRDDGSVEYSEARLYHLGTDIGETRDWRARKEYDPLVEELTQLCRARRDMLNPAPEPNPAAGKKR